MMSKKLLSLCLTSSFDIFLFFFENTGLIGFSDTVGTVVIELGMSTNFRASGLLRKGDLQGREDTRIRDTLAMHRRWSRPAGEVLAWQGLRV